MAKPSKGETTAVEHGGVSRRELLAGAGAAVAISSTGCRPEDREASATEPRVASVMPTIYLPHGGGPWPWTPAFTPALAENYVQLRGYLEALPNTLPQRPTGIVIVSAHWEASMPTVLTSERPSMLYDYSGFPQDTYQIRWNAPGSPQLAQRVRQLLGDAGIDSGEDASRGFDHGTFVPMKLAFPDADIPTLQLSLDASYDPQRHLDIGRALSVLREEGILIVGSGMSWEDFRASDLVRRSSAFDEWFQHTATAEPASRDGLLANWTDAPHARAAHPHEEHLLPMMVAAGAAGQDSGKIAWTGSLLGIRLSAVHFDRISIG